MASLATDIAELTALVNEGVATLTVLHAFGVNIPGNTLTILKQVQNVLHIGGIHEGMTPEQVIKAIQSVAASGNLGFLVPTFVDQAFAVAGAFATNLQNLEGNQAIVVGSGNITIPKLISTTGADVTKHLRLIVSPDGSDVNNMLGLG